MNPWSVKMVHQLTEAEMYEYAGHLQKHMTVEREEYIERAVDHIIEQWEQMRSQSTPGLYPHTFPHHMHLPTSKATVAYSGQPPMTPIVSSFATVIVKVYPWMDENLARYVAREQILEQAQPDVG